MSKRYTSGVVSSTSPTVNAAGASGVFTLNQQSAAQSTNNWPPYKVEKSLRFRSAASGYLSRTPGSAGNRQKWTWSAWVKFGTISAGNGTLFNAGTTSGEGTRFYLRYTSDILQTGYGSFNYFSTTNVFRDPSAWYHIVCAYDSTQTSASNRILLYINGTLATYSFGTNVTLNQNGAVNNSVSHQIGSDQIIPGGYFDGYMAEVNFIDGQQLTPSSFGANDKDGNWSPIAYTGSYGTNGFYLNFKDVTSAATTGYDYSGNGNNWTLSGFNVSTANTSYDSVIDVPEDQSDGTANNRGNYCTLNPLHAGLGYGGTYYTISDANQRITGTSGTNSGGTIGTISNKTGKFYFEVNMTGVDGSGYVAVGASDVDEYSALTPYNYLGYGSKSYSYYASGVKASNGTNSSYGSSFTTGDVIGVAIDCDNGAIYFSKNNTWQASGDPTSGATRTGAAFTWTGASQSMIPQFEVYRSGSIADTNFGQRPFTYAPPSGFKALNTYNLPEPTIKQPSQYMNATLWSGNNTSNREIITGGRSDFVWIKRRDSSTSHILFDAIRGAGKTLYSHLTNAEVDNGGYYVQTFGTTSFTLGIGGDAADNITGGTYVGWNWNAGGSTVTNTAGSISSQVRANQTSGFSILTYTGTGSIATIGHGLGVAPAMMIIKPRSAAVGWLVYHQSIGNTGFVYLNDTAEANFSINGWNNTSPTSSVFTTGVNGFTNQNGQTQVAYCFASVAGYSAFGTYTGNGSADGPFVYTGFRPRFIMVKCTSNAENWYIGDGARQTFNASTNPFLIPNLSNAESNAYAFIDLISNGFKCRFNGADTNGSGRTYIYAAFAETPFKYARSR